MPKRKPNVIEIADEMDLDRRMLDAYLEDEYHLARLEEERYLNDLIRDIPGYEPDEDDYEDA